MKVSEATGEQMRRAMVASQLRTNAVTDPKVLAAMGTVERERFVPAARHAIAYADVSVPLTHGRALSMPLVTGRLLTALHPRATDRALVIGAATGYSAALLAGMVAEVVALEQDPELVAHARGALPAGVELVEGPLNAGWPAGAPYNLILIDGAVEHVPQAIIDQLADGGRLATAIVENNVTRLAAGRRVGEAFGVVMFADVEAVPLPGFVRPKAFSF